MPESKGKINQYTCKACNSKITTINSDDGVTPMFVDCKKCEAMSVSSMYRVDQNLKPDHEWYRATPEDLDKMVEETMEKLKASPSVRREDILASYKNHADQGGLYLRELKEESDNKFTWNDLQKVIAGMDDQEREMQVHIAIDDESRFRKVSGAEEIPEDVYVNKDDEEDCGDLAALKYSWGADFNEDDYIIATPKGRMFLWSEY